jgi:hypothetical protein
MQNTDVKIGMKVKYTDDVTLEDRRGIVKELKEITDNTPAGQWVLITPVSQPLKFSEERAIKKHGGMLFIAGMLEAAE